MRAVVWFGFLWGVFFNDKAHLLAAAAGLLGGRRGEERGGGREAVGLTPHNNK